MLHSRLHGPVGNIARRCPTVEGSTSLELAIRKMREAGIDVIPVTKDQRLHSILSLKGVFKALSEGAELTESAATFSEPADRMVSSSSSAEALRALEWTNYLVVVDLDDHVVGIVNSLCFVGSAQQPDRPPMVGGMATPFGVYLTNGSVSGGKKGLALMSTGSFLFVFFLSGRLLSLVLAPRLPDTALVVWMLESFPVLALIATFRFLPIAGFHGAEHQVVHAIEQGEELTQEVVARMPRVHPRCGTNLAVAATLFLTIQRTTWVSDEDIRLFVAMIVTLFFWRPIGSFVQSYITTRPASPKELQSGIDAAQELLRNYAVADHRTASPFRKIFNSGMLHVMSGAILAYVLVSLVAWMFGVEPMSL